MLFLYTWQTSPLINKKINTYKRKHYLIQLYIYNANVKYIKSFTESL